MTSHSLSSMLKSMIHKNDFLKISGILLFLFTLIWFQNCGIKGKLGGTNDEEHIDFTYFQSIDESTGFKNIIEMPTAILNSSSADELLGTCIIENPPRGITVTMNRRFGKSDCADFCRKNSLKFDRDRLSCRFEGEYILYFNYNSSWFDKEHCTIKSDNNVLLDGFKITKQKCTSQCTEMSQSLTSDKSLECYWQRQLLKYREAGSEEQTIGQCKITVKVTNPIDDKKTLDLIGINYQSGTTEKHCNYVKDFVQSLFNNNPALREINQEFD